MSRRDRLTFKHSTEGFKSFESFHSLSVKAKSNWSTVGTRSPANYHSDDCDDGRGALLVSAASPSSD